MASRSEFLKNLAAPLSGLCLLVVMGCPTTTAAPPVIEEVEVLGSLKATEFDLRILGRGFGLSGVSYSLAEGSGVADVSDLRVKITDTVVIEHTSQGPNVHVVSPEEIVATFVLSAALPPARYDVELLSGEEVIAKKEGVLEVKDGDDLDAGVLPDTGVGQDAEPGDGADPRDGGVGDVGPTDTGTRADAGSSDAAIGVDAGAQDLGPADSGLGGFQGNFQFRQQIILTNPSGLDSPSGVTVKIPVPHRQLVVQNRAEADGSDLAVYLGMTRLNHQWDDRDALNEDTLEIIFALPVAVPPGPANLDLALYYGDPMAGLAPTDSVFAFAQRFTGSLPGGWLTNDWTVGCTDRLGTPGGSVCVLDQTDNPTRRTVASPATSLQSIVAGNEIYEISAYIAGSMDEANDLLYFAYSGSNQDFANAVLLNSTDFLEYPPNASTTFLETTGSLRTENGWRLPASPGQQFMRTRARFVPSINQPSLHFRYISPNGSANPQTLVGVDDLWVRRALNPDWQVTLGPVETR